MNKDTKKEYTVSFITLGCKVNQYETEAMTEVLEAEGFKVLPPDEISDIYITVSYTHLDVYKRQKERSPAQGRHG